MDLSDRRVRLAIAALLVAGGALAAILLLGGEDDSDSLSAALAYVPADAATVVALETDLSDDQWEGFAQTAGRDLLEDLGGGFESDGDAPAPALPSVAGLNDVETQVSAALLGRGINYEGEIRPLLGGQLVAASTGPPESLTAPPGDLFALEVGDAAAAERAARKLADLEPVGEYRGARLFGQRFEGAAPGEPRREAELAIDGEVVVFAEEPGELEAAIDRARGGDHLSLDRFEAGLEGTDGDALLRLYLDPAGYLALPALAPLSALPWPAALRSLGAAASFEGKEVSVEAVARTDPAGLSEGDLPLPPESGRPDLVRREGEVASASVDQSYTTVFLLRAARALYADSDFIRDVDRIQAELGIDFEQEVLRQFAGPSASSITIDGHFAARSTVADSAAMRALLPKLAPKLPQLVRDLDSLGTEGLLALLFIAPDAPVATAPLGAGTTIAQAPPAAKPESEEGELLYVIQGPRGPKGRIPIPGVELPDRIILGMIGDTFVVASDYERAHQIAAAPGEAPAEGLSGASVIEAEELGEIPERLRGFIDLDLEGVSSARGSLESSLEEIRGSLSAAYD